MNINLIALAIFAFTSPLFAGKSIGVRLLDPSNGVILVKGGTIRIKAQFERVEDDSLHRVQVDLWNIGDQKLRMTLAQWAMPRDVSLLDTTLKIPASVKPGDFYRLEVRYLPYMLDPKVADRVAHGYAVSACIRDKSERKRPCEEVINKK